MAIFDAVSGSMCTRHRATARRWRRLLGGDIDHPGPSERVEVRELRSAWAASVGAQAKPAVGTRNRPQPPIWLIERPGRMKSTWPMRWPAHLLPTAAVDGGGQAVVEVGRSRPPSDRSSARRSVSSSAKRQVRNWPSAVMPHAVAVVAERLGHARDDADIADAVAVARTRAAGSARARARRPRSSGNTASMRSRISRGGHHLVAAPRALRRRAA